VALRLAGTYYKDMTFRKERHRPVRIIPQDVRMVRITGISLSFPIQELEVALRTGDSAAVRANVSSAIDRYAQKVERDRAEVIEIANQATSPMAEHAAARKAVDQAVQFLRLLEPVYLKQALSYADALDAVADLIDVQHVGSADYRNWAREQIARFKDLSRLAAETICEARATVEAHAARYSERAV
jgi:hypothetical protein